MAKRRETVPDRKKRARSILTGLRKLYPEAGTALRHGSALELLVATILSAQSTDDTINKVVPVLFKRFPTARAIARADRTQLEETIHATGFFRQKAKSLQGTCKKLLDDFGGEVPSTMEELTTLPGVARKTANVVLGSWFQKNVGVVVDTHVGRLATRLELTWTSKDAKDAVKIENDLMETFPKAQWTYASHALIWHGRRVCSARKPKCSTCSIAKHCPSLGSFD